MAITKQKRLLMETTIYKTFDALDPSGTNSKKYKAMFKEMNDAKFEKFFKDLFADENKYLIYDVVDFEYPLKIENVKKAADYLGVPITEYVAMPFVNKDKENPAVTKTPAVVGYLHLKRMQQMLSKKNSTSTEIAERSAMTGQVTGHDKNARITDAETYVLSSIEADDVLRELMGPRSDDRHMKSKMYSDISTKGYCSLNSLPNHVENKTSLNTIDVYMIGMGLKSDMVTKGLEVVKTLDD